MTTASKKSAAKKQKFSSFSYKDAFKQLGITQLLSWQVPNQPIAPSEFFRQRLVRMECFDLQNYEESKKVLIDAICEEAIQDFKHLKIWKGANLEGADTSGYVDYLIAERKAYLEAPVICVIEAKKDDFEQGLAQCLVEMQACQWSNFQIDRPLVVFGMVTNGDVWKFYRLTLEGEVYETLAYALNDLSAILGVLHHIFHQCEQAFAG